MNLPKLNEDFEMQRNPRESLYQHHDHKEMIFAIQIIIMLVQTLNLDSGRLLGDFIPPPLSHPLIPPQPHHHRNHNDDNHLDPCRYQTGVTPWSPSTSSSSSMGPPIPYRHSTLFIYMYLVIIINIICIIILGLDFSPFHLRSSSLKSLQAHRYPNPH